MSVVYGYVGSVLPTDGNDFKLICVCPNEPFVFEGVDLLYGVLCLYCCVVVWVMSCGYLCYVICKSYVVCVG